jgi:hypothetical protein
MSRLDPQDRRKSARRAALSRIRVRKARTEHRQLQRRASVLLASSKESRTSVSSGGDIWREWGRMGGRLLTIWSSSDVDLQSDHTSSSSSTAQTASASKGESLVGIQNSDSAELGFCRPSSASASSKTRSSSKKSKSKGNDHTMHSLGVATIHPDDTAHNRGVQATRGGASAQELAHLEAAFASNGVDQAGGFIAVIRYVPTFPPSRNLVLTSM